MGTNVESSRQNLVEKHQDALNEAIQAVHSRAFYTRYPEPPSKRIYGESANEIGLAAYQRQVGIRYPLLQEGDTWITGSETSPFTLEKLNTSYPAQTELNSYIERAVAGSLAWKRATPLLRAALLFESLERVKARFFELGYATMHTTGQTFVMSFQASGPHGNDRALETIAMGLHELTRFPAEVIWKKPMGKVEVELKKYYKMVPKGIGVCIGCSTFPVWNTSPGIYANLITGNPVICKPHPGAVYPIALVIDEIQKTLKEYGFDPHVCQLAVDSPENLIAHKLASHPAVKLIDYTGGSAFGEVIESLPGKKTFTEKSGINSVIIESCKDLKAMMQNLAFSLSLYSGQMCTCPQNIFIPKAGITVETEHVSYEEVVATLAQAVKSLITHEKMGPGTLGTIQNEQTLQRVQEAQRQGHKMILESLQIQHPDFPNARTASPALIEIPPEKREVLSCEMFGPVVYVVPVDTVVQAVELASELARTQGAITFAAYTVNPELQEYISEEMAGTFTSISFNLVGPIWVNQSAGFSDFHVSGGNPAGNASLTDPEFVLGRFEIVGIRIHA